MEGQNEVIIALIAGLLGSSGLFAVVFKYLFEYHSKKLDHERAKELKSLEQPLRSSLQALDAQYDLVHRIKAEMGAEAVTIVRMSNGEVFADKSHKWKFTATTFAGPDELRQALQGRSIYEAPKMFSRFENDGYAFLDKIELGGEVFTTRLYQRGINAYCMVASSDCMNGLLVLWKCPTEINDDLAKILKSELLTIENHLR